VFRGRFVLKALLALVLIGLLVSAVAGMRGLAWWRGYRAAQWMAQEGETARPYDYGPFEPGRWGYRPRLGLFSTICGAGLLFKVLMVLLLVSLVTRLFGRHACRPACGPWGVHRHWYWHHHGAHDRGERQTYHGKFRPDEPDGDTDED
jgi:hypothetical protein